jgi:DNA repair protein RecO (recombination protein O)
MELPKTTGVVLRTHPVTESSLIVVWLTREFGKLRTVAKGARRPKSPFRGRVEPFYLDELIFLRSRRSDLHILHECSLIEPHRHLRENLKKLHAAMYFCELADLATEPEHAEEKLFTLLCSTLRTLHESAWQPMLVPWFEINLLAALGFDPTQHKSPLPPDLMKLFEQFRTLRPEQLNRLKLSPNQSENLESFFLAQAEQQFGRLPRSRRFVVAPGGAPV